MIISLFKSFNCYYHTVKYLKFKQIYYRILYRYKKIKKRRLLNIPLRSCTKHFIQPVIKLQKISNNNEAVFLNHTVNISQKEIWRDARQEKLWLYNLHYFNDLISDANPNHKRKMYLQHLIQRWISENPPFSGEGWEPYPTSLRIVNWIQWHLNGHSLDEKSLMSLAAQADMLSQKIEWHLLGNHLLANAKALIFAGLFFQGPDAAQWLQQGVKIFTAQITEQILNDGGHFERSPMYHAVILEDCLDLVNLYQTYAQTIPPKWLETIQKMFDWLQIMLHPDEKLSFFNDAAFNIAADFSDLKSYAQRLGLSLNKTITKPAAHLAVTGYCRLQNTDAVLLCDIGDIGPDYLPGHAHADTLSFEFSLKKNRIFVNSGTSTYQPGAERIRQRGSVAHNTLVLAGQNSSQVWGAFRVAKRAYVKQVNMKESLDTLHLSAAHNGYQHVRPKAQHQRIWELKAKQCQIKDHVEGKGSAEIFIYYHLHPDYVFESKTEHELLIIEKKSAQCAAVLSLSENFSIIPGSYHPEFGVSAPNQCLRLGGLTDLPAVFDLTIRWS